ncbi:MAG: peptidase S9 [Planctomycetaceae bacterium]|nr:peptidase S9 [Planctomycetaceae bacterium]
MNAPFLCRPATAGRASYRGAVLSALLFFAPALAAAAEDARFDAVRQLHGRLQNLVVRDQLEPHWLEGDQNAGVFWYRTNIGKDRHAYVLVDAANGVRQPVFDDAELLKLLERDPSDPPRKVLAILPADDGNVTGDVIVVLEDEGAWRLDQQAGALTKLDEAPEVKQEEQQRSERERWQRRGGLGQRTTDASPDGEWKLAVRDHNLWLLSTGDGEPRQLTFDGTADNFYEADAAWSPDGKKFVAMQVRPESDHPVNMVASSPEDQLQPKLKTIQYLKPGDDVRRHEPHLFQLEGDEIAIDAAPWNNPWELGRVRWAPDGSRFYFYYNQRGHQVVQVVSVDAATGDAKPVIDERSDTFVHYSGKHFLRYLPETGEFIWMSERSGWNHLYLIDAVTGEVKNAITAGEFVVDRVPRVDAEQRQVWFTAAGLDADQDPYYTHYCRVDLDGQNLVRLTAGDGTHRVRYSPDRRWLIDSYSRVDMAPVHELRSAEDGRLICTLERGDTGPLRAAGWIAPERFVAKGRDGETDIYGVIYRPTGFDPDKKYPVLEQLYAGPHGFHVPKAFAACQWPQIQAELGLIVVQIDGMGTSGRSKAFHDVCWHDLADSGFPDRKLWMQAAAKEYPQMDLSRVAVKGHSAGGQSAMRALLDHHDFYKVAVAGAGCHDNRMDKIWWNEQWMGWPIGPHYAASSNVVDAHKLQGDLLLIVGELDENVDPASTMQVVDALLKADKDFELLYVPGAGHGVGGPWVDRHIWKFLSEKLRL